jgi:hypothetical protein
MGACPGRLIEITTQPLLDMLADKTPQRHYMALRAELPLP